MIKIIKRIYWFKNNRCDGDVYEIPIKTKKNLLNFLRESLVLA